uniref:Uncharacterized protein n=1 Tax=viral metagenome TaxID=1070528 RepID=A0A6M3IRZ3_9ZZZZ
MVAVIIQDRPYRYGRHRSEQEANLRKDGMATMTDEQLDKCRYMERKSGVQRSFFDKSEIDQIK